VKTYIIKANNQVKIGITKDVPARLKELQTGNSAELRAIEVLEGNREKELHKLFADYRLKGEWFSAEPVERWLAAERAKKDSLVGRWFYSFPGGVRQWRGQIVSMPDPGFYLVLTYDWICGTDHSEELVQVQRMCDENWQFFEDYESWINAGEIETLRLNTRAGITRQ